MSEIGQLEARCLAVMEATVRGILRLEGRADLLADHELVRRIATACLVQFPPQRGAE